MNGPAALPDGVPGSESAKSKRPYLLRCVSAFMYIKVLRYTSRSTREIGASLTRSLWPKITPRRRSL